MDDLLEFLVELFIDGIGGLLEKTSGKAKGKSRAAYWFSLILIVLMVTAMAVYFSIQAYLAWQAGNTRELWVSGGCLALMAALLAFVGLRRFFRWRKTREERMYDPRYQK